MNDESNEESINLLQSSVDTNIFSKFLMLQYGCEIKEDLDLNIKDYELYKNSLKTEESDNISDISSGFDVNSSSDSNESVPIMKNKKPKINVKRNWYKKKRQMVESKNLQLLLIKGFLYNLLENILDMVTVHLVVYLMFLYLVLFHHVDLVDSVKFMTSTFLN